MQYDTQDCGRAAQTAPQEAELEHPSGADTDGVRKAVAAAADPTAPTNAMDKIGRTNEKRIYFGIKLLKVDIPRPCLWSTRGKAWVSSILIIHLFYLPCNLGVWILCGTL